MVRISSWYLVRKRSGLCEVKSDASTYTIVAVGKDRELLEKARRAINERKCRTVEGDEMELNKALKYKKQVMSCIDIRDVDISMYGVDYVLSRFE